jgi:peptidoglycan/xylan/chitin deacetylase (PgdA/CDA1 family)
MRLYRPLSVLKLVYPEAVFRVNTDRQVLFLTFDDGPDPLTTSGILRILGDHNIKATFFCNGSRSEKHPDQMTLIISQGHTVGNHGYDHPDGWCTDTGKYIEDIRKGSEFTSNVLFRPPYGRIRPSQYRHFIRTYSIIFWDIMTYDYDNRMTPERILSMLKKRIRPGSVIVFHDKASSSVLSILNDFIIYASGKGFTFLPLTGSGKE